MLKTLLVAVFLLIPFNSPAAQTPQSIVTLDVSALSGAGNLAEFAFTSFQFNAYLVGFGDPSGPSDYSANVIANDEEYYTYLDSPGCAASGRGGHCTPPPSYITSGNTYSDTYQNVTTPPTGLDIFYHFSGNDAAGLPLVINVSNPGSYTLSLIDNLSGASVPLGGVFSLSTDAYTLEYQTSTINTETIVTINTVPIPPSLSLMSIVLLISALNWRLTGKTVK
ncbi:MAG: hypothetical protein ABSB19_20240 [Methylomonas sp.]|jgi:hypothetical protein